MPKGRLVSRSRRGVGCTAISADSRRKHRNQAKFAPHGTPTNSASRGEHNGELISPFHARLGFLCPLLFPFRQVSRRQRDRSTDARSPDISRPETSGKHRKEQVRSPAMKRAHSGDLGGFLNEENGQGTRENETQTGEDDRLSASDSGMVHDDRRRRWTFPAAQNGKKSAGKARTKIYRGLGGGLEGFGRKFWLDFSSESRKTAENRWPAGTSAPQRGAVVVFENVVVLEAESVLLQSSYVEKSGLKSSFQRGKGPHTTHQ